MHLRHLTRTAAIIAATVATEWTKGVPYVDRGATAFDAYDGIVPVITTGTVNWRRAGYYTVTYTAQDRATPPNVATATRRVHVVQR
jgi:hypothetical protein